jgi:hypothetical protein
MAERKAHTVLKAERTRQYLSILKLYATQLSVI